MEGQFKFECSQGFWQVGKIIYFAPCLWSLRWAFIVSVLGFWKLYFVKADIAFSVRR